MKLIVVLCCLISVSCSQDMKTEENEPSEVKSDYSELSQTEINLSAEERYKLVKYELDSVIILLNSYQSDDSLFIPNFLTAQNKWIEYRDAQMLMLYTENEPLRDGSAFNSCYYNEMTNLTQERVSYLNRWIIGQTEGNTCRGSINSIK